MSLAQNFRLNRTLSPSDVSRFNGEVYQGKNRSIWKILDNFNSTEKGTTFRIRLWNGIPETYKLLPTSKQVPFIDVEETLLNGAEQLAGEIVEDGLEQ